MRLGVIIIVAFAALGACAAGTWLWSARAPTPRQAVVPAQKGFFDASKKYDATGGQQMKPR